MIDHFEQSLPELPPKDPGLVKITYRTAGKLVTSFQSSRAAHIIAESALSQKIDHHVIEGCWDPELRKHVIE